MIIEMYLKQKFFIVNFCMFTEFAGLGLSESIPWCILESYRSSFSSHHGTREIVDIHQSLQWWFKIKTLINKGHWDSIQRTISENYLPGYTILSQKNFP